MGVDFNILENEGPKMSPWRTMADVERIHTIDPVRATPFVAEALKCLRQEVGNKATVLGFVGLPYTLATYLVEGGSSSDFKYIKTLGYQTPVVLHTMLDRLAQNVAEYAIFQIESGAQVLQLFDSWAGVLSPEDYDLFAAPYQRKVIKAIKRVHPAVPVILYINRSGALLERMASVGVDVLSLDWTVNIDEARERIGDNIGIQGNLDPMLLFAADETIISRTQQVLRTGGGRNHIMNLGHGIDAQTSEDKAQVFINTVINFQSN